MKKSFLTFFLLGSVFISENAYSDAPPPASLTRRPDVMYIYSNELTNTNFCIFNKNSKKNIKCLKHGEGVFVNQKDFPIVIANCNDLSSCRTYQLDLDYAPTHSWRVWGSSDHFWTTKAIFVSNKPSCRTWYDQCLDKGCNANFMKNMSFIEGADKGKTYSEVCETVKKAHNKESQSWSYQKTWCSDLMDNYIYKDGQPCQMP